MSFDFDIAVIGGGPAGCSAAITAARGGARVALLEKGSFPRQKVCGEFVSAESLHLLRDLIGDDRLLASAPLLSEARFHVAGHVLTLNLPNSAASITRWEMDSALWSAAGCARVALFENGEVNSVSNGCGFRIESSAGAISARSLILAAGRNSRLRPLDARPGPKWIGLKAHFFESHPPLRCDLYFFQGGYCGVQPVGKDKINVCAMVRADVARSLDELFLLDSQLETRSRGWNSAGSASATAPLEFRPPRPVNGSQLLAGDAAGFIDPFVGDGISMALHSGQMAAGALLQSQFDPGHAAPAYASEYTARLAPAYRNAARVRKLLRLPGPWRSIAIRIAGLPVISQRLFRATRAR